MDKGGCQAFKPTKDRIETFLKVRMEREWPTLWSMVRKLLLLSHGQASVERGFSINKHLIVENQQQDNLIGRRLVKDAINHAGGRHNIDVHDI